MNLVLLISLALCVATQARRPRGETAVGLGDIKLLNRLLETAAAAVKNTENDLASNAKPKRVPTKHFARPNRFLVEPYRASGEPNSVYAPHGTHQKVYSDGPFSDIPSDAFHLERRKDFRERHVAKKDLGRFIPDPESVPEELIATCLEYFSGGASPSPHATELTLDICTELLDTEGIEAFPLDKQTKYSSRVHKYPTDPEFEFERHHSEECECCPLGHHDSRGKEKVARSENFLDDILKLFEPVGHRSEWAVLNSKNSDDRLRTYVDLKK